MSGELLVISVFTLHQSRGAGSVANSPAEPGAPTAQERLFGLLTRNGHDVLEQAPGFLGSDLTCSEDGHHVVHHARWAGEPSLRAMLARPDARASMEAIRTLASVQVLRGHTTKHFRPASTAGRPA